jgi:hypothetical protein
VITDQMSFESITERDNGLCFGSLDRTGVGSLRSLHPPPEGMVLAGFTTQWIPGADPFPCNRFKRVNVVGAFEFFNVANDPAVKLALLELVEFQPVASSISNGDRGTCQFKILRSRWTRPPNGGYAGSASLLESRLAAASEISTRPRDIVVPRDVGRWNAIVTDEYIGPGAARPGTDSTVFLIVQDDASYDANQRTACAGYFRFRLRMLAEGEAAPT